jgi:hypothetical protein
MMRSGIVDDEKLIKTISKSVRFFSVAIRVMVLPEPGGPQSKKGLCSLIQLHNTS